MFYSVLNRKPFLEKAIGTNICSKGWLFFSLGNNKPSFCKAISGVSNVQVTSKGPGMLRRRRLDHGLETDLYCPELHIQTPSHHRPVSLLNKMLVVQNCEGVFPGYAVLVCQEESTKIHWQGEGQLQFLSCRTFPVEAERASCPLWEWDAGR